MTTHAALRARLADWPKYPGCHREPRAPLVTPGFPGTFNLSFTEHHWLREYGGYVDWRHDYVFTTIQSCARLADLEPVQPEAGAQHLGVFEMADLCGAIALRARPDYAALQAWHVGELVRFLGELGIPPGRIHPSYSAGGLVAELTAERYRFHAEVPPDHVSREAFLLAGVPERNLVADRTRATLLSLHLHRPTPWGYRNEIHVDVGGAGRPRLVDVATVEYLLWRPRFAGPSQRRGDIVGLEPLDGGASIVGCGVERLAMAADGLERIHDVDSLRPFYDGLAGALGRRLEPADYRAGESLRTLHRIHADLAFHAEADADGSEHGTRRPSPRRRKKLARLRRQVPVRLQERALARLLLIHARSQPWHEALEAAIEPTLRALATYRASRARGLIPEG
jgi:hypothetical protein